jgi:DNA polymerase III epsilon subunit-like protein
MSELANEQPRLVLVFDTETSGLPVCPGFGEYYPIDDFGKYANSRLVQIAWQVIDLQSDGEVVREYQTIISPQGGFRLSLASTRIHGISQEHAERQGIPIEDMLVVLYADLKHVDMLVAHNLAFDVHILASEVARAGDAAPPGLLRRFLTVPSCCTMRATTRICSLTTAWGSPKWPRLEELHRYLIDGDSFEGAHDALGDARATSKCLVRLLQNGLISVVR